MLVFFVGVDPLVVPLSLGVCSPRSAAAFVVFVGWNLIVLFL